MFAQRLAGGKSLTTQPKVLIVSIDNPSVLVYAYCFTTFYSLRPRVKPPHLVSWFHKLSNILLSCLICGIPSAEYLFIASIRLHNSFNTCRDTPIIFPCTRLSSKATSQSSIYCFDSRRVLWKTRVSLGSGQHHQIRFVSQ